MNKFNYTIFPYIFTVIYNWSDAFLGRWDNLLLTLAFITINDYITTLVRNTIDRTISAKKGGLLLYCKLLIFIIIGIANIMDTQLFHTNHFLRTITIYFYLYHESISLLTNAEHLGLHIPKKLRTNLKKLYHDIDKEEQ